MTTTKFTDGITLSDDGWFDDADKAAYASLTSVSGTNTIAATGSAAMSAYAAGQQVRFIPANTNTGATTINITQSGASALGAKNIFCRGVACVGGEIKVGVPCVLVYDGTQFHITSFPADNVVGTFTPTLTFGGGATGITYSSQVGKYTKIGNVVHYYINITLSNKGSSSGDSVISGLPFAAFNGDPNPPASVWVTAMNAIAGFFEAIVIGNTSTIFPYYIQTGAGTSERLTDGHFNNTSAFVISGFYFT